LAAEYILLDEAQDTNHAVLAVLQAQTSQMVYVGDRHQQIYEWRGAVNAMEQVTGCDEAYLTQSFRFGATIADAASQVIATLGEKHQLRGNANVQSAIANSRATRAVLSRTNASVMMEVLDALQAGQRPHIVGGTSDQTRLLGDVAELQKGRPGSSPEFFGFTDWHDVVEFGKSEEGKSVAMIVDLVQQHGASKLWTAVKNVASEERNADVILSTVHKAKGREWDSVRLTPDFADSAQAAALRESSEEVRLFYVAITRARKLLSVEPTMLTHFTSGAWQTPQAPAATSPSAPHLPSSEPSKRTPPRNYVAPGAIPRPPPRR
jgi:superfamily I DNA/RNA helicase